MQAMIMLHWTLGQRVVVSLIYTLAIGTGTFRTVYRWYISRFWWEDIWATISLLLGIVCFVIVWIPRLPARWMQVIVLTSGLWAARMSMIATIIRITNHRAPFRRSAYTTAVAFGIMWTAILSQKLYMCTARSCFMNRGVAISQLVTDVISDSLLVALPLCFLRGINIEHGQRVLLLSSFASSIGITVISVLHSVFLFLPHGRTSLILAHVKTALALIVCNLLIIVTFAYRIYRRNDLELSSTPTKSDGAQFTSVLLENGN